MYGIRTDILKKENIRFNAVTFMEDMHVALSLLERGYTTGMITQYAWGQARASGAAGGCSSYRNFETQKTAAIKLAELHHPFVKVVKRKSREKDGWVRSVGEYRFDVRVNWQEAALSGQKRLQRKLF